MVGKTIGKYRFVEKLGRGAMGTVYKAVDEISDMPTPARRHRAELPAWTLTILDRALAKSPADRYQSAEEFRSALLDAIHGSAAEAPSRSSSGGLAPPKSAVPTPNPIVDTSIATALFPVPPVALKKKRSFGVAAALVALFMIGALLVGIVALKRSRAAKPATAESAAATSPPPVAPVAAAPAPPIPEPAASPAPPPVDTAVAPAGASSMRPARAARAAKPPDPVPEAPAPPMDAAPASVATPTPVAPPFAFAAKLLVKDGDKPRERDATVRLADGQVTVTAQDHTILGALPYDAVLSVIYSKARQPLWDAPGGALPIQRVEGGAFGFLKGGRHWVSLRTKERFVVLRVDEHQVPGVLSAIEERTGKTAVRVAESKGSQ